VDPPIQSAAHSVPWGFELGRILQYSAAFG